MAGTLNVATPQEQAREKGWGKGEDAGARAYKALSQAG